MAGLRVLVGTRKGASLLTADGTRRDGDVTGPTEDDVVRSDGSGATWREVSGDLPSDFGFPVAVHAHEPETVYVAPVLSDAEHHPPEGALRVHRSRTAGDEWEPLTRGLPPEHCYTNHAGPDEPLPALVASGAEPLLVVGAMAGG